MRLVLQRVSEASVVVDGSTVGAIGRGFLALLGIGREDTEDDLRYLADKMLGLRVFPDNEGKMNRSLGETDGEVLLVSQFTLYGDCRKGRRPSFVNAAPPQEAEVLYTRWIEYLRERGHAPQTGVFGAMMEVKLVNDGPVTLLLESRRRENPG